jgi:C-terminal processing protease CtpA/Prc
MRFDDGVYYVDLGSASMPEISAAMNQLAKAPGVVFDVRGYPNSNRDVLLHLTTKSIDYEEGMTVGHVIRPDHGPTSVPTWEKHGRAMRPLYPQISGRVAFLTGPRAISAAETLMSMVEHHRLGAIVGSPTAGTNGDVAGIMTPTGCRVTFTGLRVVRPNGSPYHLTGLQPTIPAERTLAGVIAGRDEVLEAGLAYVRGSSR